MEEIFSKASSWSRVWWDSWDPIVCSSITSLRSVRWTTSMRRQVAAMAVQPLTPLRPLRLSSSGPPKLSRLKEACRPSFSGTSYRQSVSSTPCLYSQSPPFSSVSAPSSEASMLSAASSKVYSATVWACLNLADLEARLIFVSRLHRILAGRAVRWGEDMVRDKCRTRMSSKGLRHSSSMRKFRIKILSKWLPSMLDINRMKNNFGEI